MKFVKLNGRYVAFQGGDKIEIVRFGDFWQVLWNGKEIEFFDGDALNKAKRWAIARYTA